MVCPVCQHPFEKHEEIGDSIVCWDNSNGVCECSDPVFYTTWKLGYIK